MEQADAGGSLKKREKVASQVGERCPGAGAQGRGGSPGAVSANESDTCIVCCRPSVKAEGGHIVSARPTLRSRAQRSAGNIGPWPVPTMMDNRLSHWAVDFPAMISC